MVRFRFAWLEVVLLEAVLDVLVVDRRRHYNRIGGIFQLRITVVHRAL